MESNMPIGLNPQTTQELTKGLNDLLCRFTDLLSKCPRISLEHPRQRLFSSFTSKFEELYTDLQIKIDEVAERILTLGGRPLHTYEAYLAATDVHAVKDISDGEEAMKHCVAAFSVLLVA